MTARYVASELLAVVYLGTLGLVVWGLIGLGQWAVGFHRAGLDRLARYRARETERTRRA